MIDDRSLERAARSFIEVGPTRAPEHAVDAALLRIQTTTQERDWFPWRFPRMTTTTRVAALVALGALILGSLAVIGGVGGAPPAPLPTGQPSTGVAPSGVPPLGALDTTFSSPRNGYDVRIPADWTTAPATLPWTFGTRITWGDDQMDELKGDAVRFSAAAQRIPDGITPDEWFEAYCESDGSSASRCADLMADWTPIQIGGMVGYLTLDGVPAADGTIDSGATIYDAAVVGPQHAYAFTLDGNIDRAMFDDLLDTVILRPGEAVDLPPLSETFTSDRYGYSIGVGGDWETTAGSGDPATDPLADRFVFPDTDTEVGIGSDPLSDGQTFQQYLDDRHAEALADSGIPAGCDGGSPGAWPTINIGGQSGRLQQLCNAALAFVEVGGRVYYSTWGNSTFNTDEHLSEPSWKAWLAGLRFDPRSAQD